MKKSTGAIILREGAADLGRVSAVLRAWGYEESEIQDFLAQQEAGRKVHDRSKEESFSNHSP
ncbi:MAG TPA: hypothetical protein VFP47_02600, partial [Pyrinomonadaceae bacterium]|nr:hypothetical protein [Pyrinomonadaceae bacterium]